MAARSVQITFVNNSDHALVLSSTDRSHGIWTTDPPARIEAGTTVVWASESSGIATGTEAEANYNIETAPEETGGSVHLHWDNPFVGSNSYDESVPFGYKSSRSGGDGDNAEVTWVFDCASTTGDGIPDDWKINGVSRDPGDGSGPQFIDLPAMGATVGRPDIFIQIDWMADATHSHAISNNAIKSVVDAFDNCPYVSRNGSVGINLHVDAGPNSIMNFSTGQTWGGLSRARQLTEKALLGTEDASGAYDWTEFDSIKKAAGGFMSTGRDGIFHYVISAHAMDSKGSSGKSRGMPGSDFIISLADCCGPAPTDLEQGGTLMHELGHNLGLHHGGGDDTNYKPNYISVMNYSFQFIGLTRSGVANILDYSNVALDTLDENSLDETKGVGPNAAQVMTRKYIPPAAGSPAGTAGTYTTILDGSLPIDWNGDGSSTSTSLPPLDITGDGKIEKLAPFDDWKNLKLVGGAIGAGGAFNQPMKTQSAEMTPAEMAKLLPVDTTPPLTTAVVAPPPNAAGWNRTDITVNLSATDDISGVARTEYSLDGGPVKAVSGPLVISSEGSHDVEYDSIDHSQNRESPKHLSVKIDKTAPEAIIYYDPHKHLVVVEGVDTLSGVAPGPIAPFSVTAATWTNYGSDTSELRKYRIADVAGNITTLTLKIRCQPDEFELSVIELVYDRADDHRRLPRNTVEFRRLRACAEGNPLLGVRQSISLGEGATRTSSYVFYDTFYDESHLARTQGSDECALCAERQPTGRESPRKGESKEPSASNSSSEDRPTSKSQECACDQKSTERRGDERTDDRDAKMRNCKPCHCQCPPKCGYVELRLATDRGSLKVDA
jgi:hypothetical protein